MVRSFDTTINRHTLDRLMQYYHCITEDFDLTNDANISSAQLAQSLSLDASLIRKDLALLGVKGHCHVGFDAAEVCRTIQRTLGVTEDHSAVVVGAGRLGGAISSYPGFANYGLHVVALFDNDPAKIGLIVGGHVVQPIEQLEAILRQSHVQLAILTVPADAAQSAADRLIHAGIRVIWNFSPGQLLAPDAVFIRHEHLFLALGQLFYRLKQMEHQP